MKITFSDFKGMAPMLLAERLPPGYGQVANNCRFGSGGIMPFEQPTTLLTPAKAGTKKSMYPYGATPSWLHWLEDVNCVRGAVASDAYDRVYWTGEGVPKMSVNGFITSGGTQYPTNSYTLGLPRPTAPTATVQGTAGTNSATQEQWVYVVTFVSAYGEESVPSLPSNGITIDTASQHVHLSNLPVSPGVLYNVATKNIYRTNTGSAATEYQYVGSVAVATTTYDDTVLAANLGEVLPSAKWLAPNSGLTGLISLPGGFLAGFYGNVLCFSEPYLPHAWNPDYQIIIKDTIVALGAYGNSILVTTTGAPVIITGSHPASMSAPEYLEDGEACVGKRGVVDLGYVVAYPGASGLWLAGTNGVQNATKGIFTRKQWQALSPSTLLGTEFERSYVGFKASGGFILDAGGNYSTIDITATAAYYSRATGRLYLMVGNDIVEWCGGSTFYTATWKSGKQTFLQPVNFGWVMVQAQGYPVSAKVYADGVLKASFTMYDSKPMSLMGGYMATTWEVEISGGSGVYAAGLASSYLELVAGGAGG